MRISLANLAVLVLSSCHQPINPPNDMPPYPDEPSGVSKALQGKDAGTPTDAAGLTLAK